MKNYPPQTRDQWEMNATAWEDLYYALGLEESNGYISGRFGSYYGLFVEVLTFAGNHFTVKTLSGQVMRAHWKDLENVQFGKGIK